MKNTLRKKTPILILGTFNSKKWAELKAFISSDFISIPVDVKKLLLLIEEQMKKESIEHLTNQIIIKYISPENVKYLLEEKNKLHLDKKINNLNWLLTQFLEKFLIYSTLEKDKLTQNKLLMEAYSSLNLPKLYEKKSRDTIKELNKNVVRDHRYYLESYLLHDGIYFHPSTSKFNTTTIPSQKQMLDDFEHFYYLNTLRLGVEIVLRQNWAEEKISISGLDEAIDFGQKNITPQFQFFTNFLMLIRKEDFQEKRYLITEKNFTENSQLWSTDDQRLLLEFLSNYLISFINKGNKRAIQLQINLYQFGLDTRILMEHNNTLTDAKFINILVLYLNLNQVKEANDFFTSYESYLNQQTRYDVTSYCKAYLAMTEKRFADAIALLSKKNDNSEHCQLLIRSLHLKCIYEQSLNDDTYSSLVPAHINRYNRFFIKNKTFSKTRKKSYQNLGLAVSLLFKIKHNKSCSINQRAKWFNQIESLVNDLKAPLRYRTWICEKIDDLKN